MRPRLSPNRALALALASLVVALTNSLDAQPARRPPPPPEFSEDGEPPPPPPPDDVEDVRPPRRFTPPVGSIGPSDASWARADRVLRVPGTGGLGVAETHASSELFPDAGRSFLQVIGTEAAPIEAARRGARPWLCSTGCAHSGPNDGRGETLANEILQSIKLQTPTSPLPLTIWQPATDAAMGDANGGKLLFDPRLMTRRDYHERCAYPPVLERAKPGAPVGECVAEQRLVPRPPTPPSSPDASELFLGLRLPAATAAARFQYLAVTDSCGNALVYPYQSTLSVPAFLVASSGCGPADGRVLRVFPGGGWIRVTAFNLDVPALGGIASVTYRVSVPALEDPVSAEPAPLLYPEVRPSELALDCSPAGLRTSPPSDMPPSAPASPGAPPTLAPPRPGPTSPDDTAKPLAHESLVVAPEPLLNGNCRIEYRSQARRRLIAPLALAVRIVRTDKVPGDKVILDADWVITPTSSTFRIPKLPIDGESRVVIEVASNPLSPLGNVVLLGDAGRYQRRNAAADANPESLRRLLGSATVHTAPLCGGSNVELADRVGRCVRGYFTVPAMLATLQVTRAPWVERPLITRNVLSAVGVAFAVDRYDPVERRAFPVAMQLGGFVEDMGDSRLGLTSYVGVAPTIPVLGSGGNTTNIGLLGGLGMAYITRTNGADEGFKPTAFLSVVVQVGQVNPTLRDGQGNAFGTYSTYTPTTAPGLGVPGGFDGSTY